MNINEFFHHVKANGLAKVSRFKIVLNVPFNTDFRGFWTNEVARSLEFSCESIDFPGRTLTTSDNRIYGPSFKTPYGTEYNEISLTLLCSEDLREKQFFDDWINYINPSTNFNFKYPNEYVVDMQLQQFSELNEPTYECNLFEAFPISVGNIQGNWSDDGFHRVQVTLSFHKWMSIQPTPINSRDDRSERGNTRRLNNTLEGNLIFAENLLSQSDRQLRRLKRIPRRSKPS